MPKTFTRVLGPDEPPRPSDRYVADCNWFIRTMDEQEYARWILKLRFGDTQHG